MQIIQAIRLKSFSF